MEHLPFTLLLTRRAVFRHAGLWAATSMTSLAASIRGASVVASPNREGHPIAGSWLAVTPLGPAELVFHDHGEVLFIWPHSGEGPNGYYQYTTSASGVWHPVSTNALILSVVGCEADDTGDVSGLVAITSRSVVSDDGGSFLGSRSADRLTRTLLDGTTTVQPGASSGLEPLSGIRMWPETTGRT